MICSWPIGVGCGVSSCRGELIGREEEGVGMMDVGGGIWEGWGTYSKFVSPGRGDLEGSHDRY